jgi:hypothetical protein
MMKNNSDDCFIFLKLRQIKNWFLLLCGATLKNKYGYKVKFEFRGFKQIWDNPWRKTPYSMHGKSWEVVNDMVIPSKSCIMYHEEKERNANWKIYNKSF